jgi:LysR family transcriptional regulator, transcriptional activator for dmlA
VHRSQRGLSLTDAGKQYLQSCKRGLRILHEGRELLEKHRASPSGLLRIGCPITLARYVIEPLLSKFLQRFPDLRVEVEMYLPTLDQEPREDVDVFFKVKAPRESSRRIRCYPGAVLGLFASREYVQRSGLPADPVDLASHRCFSVGRWTLRNGKKVVTPDLTFHVVTGEPALLLQLVLDGAGIANLPLWLALSPDISGRLVRVLPAWQPTPIVPCALYFASSGLTPKVKAFLEFIGTYLGTDLDPRLRGTKASDCFIDVELSRKRLR